MSPMVKRITLVVFALAAILLVWGGSWYQGLLLWTAGLLGLIWVDKRHIERRLSSILPKLYVCAKPDEYLEWLEDLNKELLFRNFFEEKMDVYRASGWLYEVGRPHLEQVSVLNKVPEKKPLGILKPLADETKSRDPLVNLQKWLLNPSDRQRKQLNDYYYLWIQGGEGFKKLKPAQVKTVILEGEAAISDSDAQKTILSLIGKLILAKWLLGQQQRQEAEQLLTELRETEVFNLMFGEVNYHLGQVEIQKKQKTKAAYFFRVALNFADGTALEAEIPIE